MNNLAAILRSKTAKTFAAAALTAAGPTLHDAYFSTQGIDAHTAERAAIAAIAGMFALWVKSPSDVAVEPVTEDASK